MSQKVKDTVVKSDEALGAKMKSLESVMAQIDKQYGRGSVMFLGSRPVDGFEAISTGSIQLDRATGIGGFPRGRIVEIFGPEASGKTTLALQVIAQAQKKGGLCAIVDAEHALDPAYATKLGINVQELLISQPDYGEQALDIVEMLIRSAALDVIVVDSVAALVPKAELEGDMGDTHVGLQARLMSQALRKLTSIVHKSGTVLIFINQVRQTINSMPFAPKEVTTGGNALKFYSSLRLEVRRIESIKKDDVIVGNRVAVKVAKNKMAPPFVRVELELIFGEGITEERELFDLALKAGIVTQAGSWFAMGGDKIGQGRETVIHAIKTDATLAKTIREKLFVPASVER